MTQTRRLAAIIAADVAGYSRLIGAETVRAARAAEYAGGRDEQRGAR